MKEVLECLKGIVYEEKLLPVVTTVKEASVPFMVVYKYDQDRVSEYCDDEELFLVDSYTINLFTNKNPNEIKKEIKLKLQNKFGVYLSSITTNSGPENEDGHTSYVSRFKFKITKKAKGD